MSPLAALLLALPLLACSSSGQDGSDDEATHGASVDGGAADGGADGGTADGGDSEAPDNISAYDPDLDQPDPVEPMTLEELGDALGEVLVVVSTVQPNVLHEVWGGLMDEWSDDGCPVIDIHNGQDHWADDCVADSGTHFAGWSLYFREWGLWMGDQWTEEFSWLSGHAMIQTPEGELLESFGDIEYAWQRDLDTDFNTWSGFIWGDFAFDGKAGEGTWLEDGISMQMEYELTRQGDDRTAAYDLHVTSLDGAVIALILDETSLDGTGAGCAEEPTGGVLARGVDATWTEIVYDADVKCDGCGMAWRDGVELGEVCSDWGQLLAWETSPW